MSLTVSRKLSVVGTCIRIISNIICGKLADKYIRFPQSDDEIAFVNEQFLPFDGVIGAIDGSHVCIIKPKFDIEHVYFNRRKGFHSKNVQIICDRNLKILNINARYGGASHDAYIWACSNVKVHLSHNHREERNIYLLGDSGYPLEPWLLTPITIPHTPAETEFNRQHRKKRNCVERCIGLLKSRFRCISKDSRLLYLPYKCGLIITSCAVLHNLILEIGDDIEDIPNDEIDVEDPMDNPLYEEYQNRNLFILGTRVRRNVVQLFE